MEAVHMLLNRDGKPISVYASREAAEAQADKYNRDPFIDGERDPDAPYSVESWKVGE